MEPKESPDSEGSNRREQRVAPITSEAHIISCKTSLPTHVLNNYYHIPQQGRPDFTVLQHLINANIAFDVRLGDICALASALPSPPPKLTITPAQDEEEYNMKEDEPDHVDFEELSEPPELPLTAPPLEKPRKRRRFKTSNNQKSGDEKPKEKKIKKKVSSPIKPSASKPRDRERTTASSSPAPTSSSTGATGTRRSGRKVIRPSSFMTYEDKHGALDSTSSSEPTNYEEGAAPEPELLDLSKLADDADRDELVYEVKPELSLDHQSWLRYAYACEVKIGCDVHIAFCHLSKNEYSIQKALETIDDPDSIPMLHVRGKNAPGIWSDYELKTFIRMMNYSKNYKRMHKISKQLSMKGACNVVNAYYAKKKHVCSYGKEFTLCPDIIRKDYLNLGYKFVDSNICENCTKKFWQEPEGLAETENLCSLCRLYLDMFKKHRPNAQPSPKIFDYSSLEHDNCHFAEMAATSSDALFMPNFKALGHYVYAVTDKHWETFLKAREALSLDETIQDLIEDDLKNDQIYIFTSTKLFPGLPIVNLENDNFVNAVKSSIHGPSEDPTCPPTSNGISKHPEDKNIEPNIDAALEAPAPSTSNIDEEMPEDSPRVEEAVKETIEEVVEQLEKSLGEGDVKMEIDEMEKSEPESTTKIEEVSSDAKPETSSNVEASEDIIKEEKMEIDNEESRPEESENIKPDPMCSTSEPSVNDSEAKPDLKEESKTDLENVQKPNKVLFKPSGIEPEFSEDDDYDTAPVLVNQVEEQKKIINDLKKQSASTKSVAVPEENEVVVPPVPLPDIFYFGFIDNEGRLHSEPSFDFFRIYNRKRVELQIPISIDENIGKVEDEKMDNNVEAKIQELDHLREDVFMKTFYENKKRLQSTADALKVPLEVLKTYIRQNDEDGSLSFCYAQMERVYKDQARRAKGRNRMDNARKRDSNSLPKNIPKMNHHFKLSVLSM